MRLEKEKENDIFTEKHAEKYPDLESTFNEFNILYDMTNGSLNYSNETLDSSTDSIRSVSETFSDILNKNISSEHNNIKESGDISSSNYFNKSKYN